MPRDSGHRTGAGGEPSATRVALGLIALGLVHLAPLSVLPGSRVASTSTDVQELMWRLLWGVHALVTDPAGLMNANTFFPDEGTYATMDYLVGVSVLAAPFRALTRNPLTVYNLTALTSIALAAWGAYLLIRMLTGSRGAACVGAAVFALNPVHTARMGQLNVLAVHALPFLLLALHRLYVRTSARGMLLVAAALIVALTSSGYQAVFAAGALAWATVVLVAVSPRTRWRALGATAGAAVLAAVLFAPLARPYVRGATERHRVRTLHEVGKHSPSVASLVLQQSVLHDRLRHIWDPEDQSLSRAQATLFPGVIVVALGVIGLLHWCARSDRRELALLYGGLAIGGFALSLGTNLPGYAELFEWLPPLRLVRAPSRYSLLGLMGLAVLTAGGVEWLRRRLHGSHPSIVWALVPAICLAHLAETWAPMGHPTLRYSPPPAVYDWLAAQPGRFGVVELPTNPEQNTTSLVYSTYHWKPLVNGYYGSFISRYHYELLFDALPAFPKPGTIERLSEIHGLRYIIVHDNPDARHFRLRGREHERQRLRRALAALPPTLRLVWRSDEAAVLEIAEPAEGWTGMEVHRIAGASSLEGRTLSFEAREIPSSVGLRQKPEVVVLLDDREIDRAAVSDSFSRFEIELPDRLERGMHTVRIRVRGSASKAQLSAHPELAIGSTGVSTAAWIRAASEDPGGSGPAHIAVDGRIELNQRPGYILAVIDPATGEITRPAAFDVMHGDGDRLASYLEGLPPGTVVAAASAGPIGEHCTSRMAVALGTVGVALDPCSGRYRTHAFVGVKGAAPGTAAEIGSPTRRAVVIVGSEAAPPRVAVRRVRIGGIADR